MNKISKRYPEDMNIKTFTRDCFDGASETDIAVEMKEKYLKKFHELSCEFIEDCIKNQIESMSQTGFFFTWLWPEFVNASIEICYDHQHKVDGQACNVYKFEKVNKENLESYEKKNHNGTNK